MEWAKIAEQASADDAMKAWLDCATKSLRFPPDRKRVRQELREHLEDRAESMMDRSMSKTEAVRKSLEMMGSPEETGELLRQVHKPWLGWVLRGVRLALIALVIVIAVKLIGGTDALRFLSKDQVLREFHLADQTYTYGKEKEVHTTVAERPWIGSDGVEFGAFTVRFEDVIYRYYRRDWIAEDGKTTTVCDLDADVLLRFTGAPWNKLPQNFFNGYVRIVDDNGTEYITQRHSYDETRYIDVAVRRVLPWAYVACIRFDDGDWPEDAKRLDIFLGEGESEQKMSVWLEDWQIRNADALPEADEAHTDLWEEHLDYAWYSIWEDRKELGSFAPTAGQKDEAELSILRAALDTYPEDTENLKEPDGDKPWTIFCGEVAECILTVREDMALQPFSAAGMKERLRIVDPAQGPDAPAIPYAIQNIEICRNVTVWHISWQTTPGVEAYELQFWPTQEGTAGTLTMELKEEREP